MRRVVDIPVINVQINHPSCFPCVALFQLDRKFADKSPRPDEDPTPPAIRNAYSKHPWLSLELTPTVCPLPGFKQPAPVQRARSAHITKSCPETPEQEVYGSHCGRKVCHPWRAPHRMECPGQTKEPARRDSMKRPVSSYPPICRVRMPDIPKPPEPELPSLHTTPTPSPTPPSAPPEPLSPIRPRTAPLAHSPPMYGHKRRGLDLDGSHVSLISFSETANPGIVPFTAAGMIGWKSGRPECKLEVYGKCNEYARPYREIYKTFKWPIESLGYM